MSGLPTLRALELLLLLGVAHLATAHAVQAADDDASKNAAWIKQLGDEDFTVREKATAELRALGEAALPDLVRAYEAEADAERKQRLAALLEPDGMRLQGNPEWVAMYKLDEGLKPSLDRWLAGSDDEKQKAEAELLARPPYFALGLRALVGREKDAARRERLYALKYKMLSDSPDRAAQLYRFAQCLHTVASNVGPFMDKWDAPEILTDRSRAKAFHSCFIDMKPYGEQGLKELKENACMGAPYLDLPAAGEVYRNASAMYERLAAREPDKKKASEFAERAKDAKKAGDEAKATAEIID
ncbi:MAG: hypothetical protein L6R28_04605 [Planctomycetes bacterium]|nr:hypothetical protein [Planctomycetota bacterium]